VDHATALVPGAVLVALALQAGGFYPDSWGWIAVGLVALLVLRTTLAERPFEGISATLLVALSALALLGAWTLASSWWSHSPGRAMIEYSRLLLYVLALLALGSVPWSRRRTTIALAGVVAGIGVVAGVALVSRLAPELWTAPAAADPRRLAWPITYWNGLGLLMAGGIVLALHIASWTSSSRALRPFAAALIPALSVTLYMTLSRGAILVGAAGLVLYAVLGRPRALLCALVAAGPPTVVAVLAAYDAPALLGVDQTAPEVLQEGREVRETLLLAMLAAAAVRTALLPLDGWLGRLKLRPLRWPARVGLAVSALAAIAAGTVLTGAASWARAQGETLLRGSATRNDDIRTRLLSVDSDGRFALWRVALDAFEQRPLSGQGAGTYELLWKRERALPSQVIDAHSLYVETLAELGAVGLALLAVGVLALIVGALVRARGAERPLYAAVAAALLVWAAHAAVDWDWELAAITIWLFGVSGVALAASKGASPLAFRLPRMPRVVISLALLVLLLAPLNVSRSQAHLNAAVDAFVDDDCAVTIDESLAAVERLGSRADGWELLAYCNIRLGAPELAVRAARQAVRLDPDSWDRHFALALALAAAGEDPRRAAARAVELNPLDPSAQAALEAFSSGGPKAWARRAARIPVPVF
jgi:hypothetical protein